MTRVILVLMVLVRMAVAQTQQNYTAEQQIVNFKKQTKVPIGIITTSAGAPVDYEDATNSLNQRLILHEHFMDSITRLVRERTPERFLHAKGTGAFGYFKVTHNITDICKADLFSAIGKKTAVAVRFSVAEADRAGSDLLREPRGFAVKFYTDDGNFDIVGLNSPIFAIKDPLLFTSFTRALKRNPATYLDDPNSVWDHLTQNPESIAMLLYTFRDGGIPDGYRHMPGYGIHTFQVVNRSGSKYFVRFHFTPDAGIKNLMAAEAVNIAGRDFDYATRDLYNAISTGNFPSWKVSIQVLTYKEVQTAKFNVFDVTKALCLKKYPLKPVGKLTLNRNAENYFAEIEQLAFNPANLVPGVSGCPDKLFEARRLAYRDAQYYRLGTDFHKIPVNCPMRSNCGVTPIYEKYRGTPKYHPNSFNGPVPWKDPNRVELINIHEEEPDNMEKAREIYVSEMTADERKRTVDNIVLGLRVVTPDLQQKTVELFTMIHPEFGNSILEGLQGNSTQR